MGRPAANTKVNHLTVRLLMWTVWWKLLFTIFRGWEGWWITFLWDMKSKKMNHLDTYITWLIYLAAWTTTYSHRPCPRWKQEVPCTPLGPRQLCLGIWMWVIAKSATGKQLLQILEFSGCARKTRIIDVVYNASNNELVRTKTLVKNAIVVIDATPFRQWYESHYALPLNRKKGTKMVSYQISTSM